MDMKKDEEKEVCDLSNHNLIEVKLKGTTVKRVTYREEKATQYYKRKKEYINKFVWKKEKEVEEMTTATV